MITSKDRLLQMRASLQWAKDSLQEAVDDSEQITCDKNFRFTQEDREQTEEVKAQIRQLVESIK